ncbi:MAG: hypothetical protein KCHDKBKB_02909 [Elusimicrobia bacterium]|nr:hypothetical protein [Elusimicrobiota bacterium]
MAKAIERKFLLAFLAIPFWPVVGWYVFRLSQSPEELGGLFAILLATIFVLKDKRQSNEPTSVQSIDAYTSLLILGYACLFHFVPPLVRAIFAMTVVARILSVSFLRQRIHIGLWMLLILSLPVIPSLQFYLGYPLRMLVAQIALPLIRASGFSVIQEGACFNFGGELVWIDAPCSGIKMLWAALLLASAYSCFYRLNGIRTIVAVISATGLAIVANAIRAAALFFTEAHILKAPTWFHEGTGLVVFGALALSMLLTFDKLERLRGLR